MKRKIRIIAAGMLSVLFFAGCASKNDEMMMDYAMPSAPQEMETSTSFERYDASYGLTADVEAVKRSEDAAEQYGGRKVILTYELSIETDAFDSLISALKERLNAAGGYLQSSYIDGKKPEVYGDRGRTATLSLCVPAEKAESFFADAKTMGTVQSEHAYTDDVTAAYFDSETRLSVLKTQLERLKSILVETDNLADVLALETEIARVTTEIESLTSELRRYDALIDYTTINITVSETVYREGPVAEKTVGERIGEGFSDSLHGVGVFFVDVFVWFVSDLPVLVVLALIGTAVFFCIRAVRKRSKARKKANKDKDDEKTYEEKKE